MSLLSFISVCKGLKPASTSSSQSSSVASSGLGQQQTVRERLIQIIYEANENNRSYYLEERSKQLFGKCLRMFFFYQKKDVYETLMLHDYGFYKFAKFANYIEDRAVECTYLKPLFRTREQFHSYDACSQLIGACFQFLDLRLKNKPNEAKIGSKIAQIVF